jgi:hypothetical protein
VQIHSQNELLPVMRGSEVLISVTTESWRKEKNQTLKVECEPISMKCTEQWTRSQRPVGWAPGTGRRGIESDCPMGMGPSAEIKILWLAKVDSWAHSEQIKCHWLVQFRTVHSILCDFHVNNKIFNLVHNLSHTVQARRYFHLLHWWKVWSLFNSTMSWGTCVGTGICTWYWVNCHNHFKGNWRKVSKCKEIYSLTK